MRQKRILFGILYLVTFCVGSAVGITTAGLFSSTSAATEQEVSGERPFDLMVGDKAPGLQVDKWIQGKPIDGFREKHVYILDFWATWCRPCVESIPHMAELHEKYKGKATVIGMNIWQRDPENVEPFVTKMGEKMPYAIATDLVPEGAQANEGKMASQWMAAAGQQGIPSVFIVDGAGTVAWIGHPAEMDEPLAEIVDGSFDLDAHTKKHWGKMEKVAVALPIQERLYAAMGEEKWEETIAACDELLALDSKEYASAGINKFQVLLQKMGDTDRAFAYGREIVETTLAEEAWALNAVAWIIVDPDFETDKRDLDLAMKAASRADELTKGEDPQILDTLARVFFTKGEVAKAIELQKKALGLLGDDEVEGYQKALDEYEKAIAEWITRGVGFKRFLQGISIDGYKNSEGRRHGFDLERIGVHRMDLAIDLVPGRVFERDRKPF